jgi:hypothetical protein
LTISKTRTYIFPIYVDVRRPYPVHRSPRERQTLNLKERDIDHNAVRIASGLLAEQRNRDLTVSRKNRLSSPKSPDGPWKQSRSYSSERKVGGHPEVKWSGCEDNHLLSSTSEICHNALHTDSFKQCVTLTSLLTTRIHRAKLKHLTDLTVL